MTITDAIIFLNCKDIQPYSFIEKEDFQHFLHILEPWYHIPYRKRYTEKLISVLYDKSETRHSLVVEQCLKRCKKQLEDNLHL